jgi:hypothetical protein
MSERQEYGKFTEKIPIETDKDGVIRVGNTRVTLETLVSAFNNGSTAD